VHQGTVSVLLDVRSKALALLAPQSLTRLLTLDRPSNESCEAVSRSCSVMGASEIDKRMAKVLSTSCALLEIYWQIHKVKLASETLRLQFCEQH
jgi:hypothetical protein